MIYQRNGAITTTRPDISPAQHEPELPGQTVIMIGSSSGIGLETAGEHARRADVVLTGRNPGRLQHAAAELGAVRSGWPLA